MPNSVQEPNEGASGRRYVALIGDIQGSQEADDRAELQERFEEAVEAANAAFNLEADHHVRDLVSPLTITAGDEFQALFRGPQAPVQAIGIVSDEMAPTLLRFGIGLGTLQTEVNPEQAIGMDGSCLRRAREALDDAKERGGWVRTRGFGDFDLDVGRMMDPVGHIRSRWTDRQAEFARALWRRGTQQEVAEDRGLSESTVSESLSASGYHEVTQAQGGFGSLLHTILIIQRSDEGEASP